MIAADATDNLRLDIKAQLKRCGGEVRFCCRPTPVTPNRILFLH